MKKLKKGLYVIIPVMVVVLMYGFQGNVITSLAKVITTRIETLTMVETITYDNHTIIDWHTGAYVTTLTETNAIVTQIEVPDDVIEQVVPSKIPTPKNDYGTFVNFISDSITKAMGNLANGITITTDKANEKSTITIKEDSIVIDAEEWISFNREVYQSIADAGKEVTIFYTYKGVKYSVTIPEGYDIMSLVNEEGYCGFLNLAAHLGATVVED